MASTSQQTIYTAFNQAAGGATGDPATAAGQGIIDALGQATDVIDAQTEATAANTDALAESRPEQSGSSAGRDVSNVLNTASDVLGGGLSLMPVISLFTSLFGGGQSEQQTPLVPFSLPPSLSLETTTSNQDGVWGENGLPRAVPENGQGGGTQITVQVQAMDSQSFLDHSNDIAQAVRQAMLNMNSLNDVVTNL